MSEVDRDKLIEIAARAIYEKDNPSMLAAAVIDALQIELDEDEEGGRYLVDEDRYEYWPLYRIRGIESGETP